MGLFWFLSSAWDIDKAQTLVDLRAARGLKPKRLPLSDIGALMRMADVDEAKIAEADISIPLIGIRVGRGVLTIDGWHRINKGVRAGVTDLPIWILNRKEEKAIRYQ